MEIGKPNRQSCNFSVSADVLKKLPVGTFVKIQEGVRDMDEATHTAIVWKFHDFSGFRVAFFDINTGEYLGDDLPDEDFSHEQFRGVCIS